ncbi:MAG TPA: response regulator [Steroidobacteraceae bacterium]|jgi:signal transduction histidine kinase|nr:response regulator [Steroidobacteraceae bacterium]
MSEKNAPGASGPKPRLLFVEDEATLREHLAQKLSDEYVVDTAGNGNEALLAVMRAKPALVVTDIVMPDMDGVELLKTLRQSPGTRAIPVLLISGRAADEYRIEGFEQGADGFLAKPYTERELRALIRAMLRSAQSRAETAGREARDQVEQQAVIERAKLKRALAELHGREEQLTLNQLQLAALKEADRRKNELLCALADELRNRLAPIRKGLEILRSRSSDDELSQRTVDMMDRQTLDLERRLDSLLDIGRITRGSISLKREKIILADVLANAVDAVRPVVEARGHELVIDVQRPVPVVIDGDFALLTQVFFKLLSNSAKFTDQGGTITLALDCQGGEAVVSVRDTGIGIAHHALEQVFEMVSQVHPDDARPNGDLGMGLSLVRTLTHLHGGSISAWSGGLGTGSVFTVRLPMVQESLAMSAQAADM